MRVLKPSRYARRVYSLLLTIVISSIAALSAWAQSSTSTVLGTVVDAQGGAVSGATVTLINEGTNDQRTAATDSTGGFLVPNLLPGTYTAKVESAGFQTYRKQGNALSASERLSLGTIQLTVGAVTETISVTAEAAVVQSASSEGSAVLTTQQLESVTQRGRNVVGFLRLLPGVSTSNESEALHGAGGIGTTLPNVGGIRAGALTIGVDGQQGQDNGSSNSYTTSVSLDAIAEVKVLLNNYQAEYGRNGGAVVNVVSKSGSREFHGSVYWYKRHEMFNAQNFFNNASIPVTAKPRYRYLTEGLTIGGPVSIPRVFNKSRQKLFFFLSLEKNPSLEPSSITRLTMPTALERSGNFSQSTLKPKDPATGAAYPGNIIPASLINKSGQALVNLLTLPNSFDPNGSYNYLFQDVKKGTRDQELFRIDYRATDKDSIFFRGTFFNTISEGYNLTNWDFIKVQQTFINKHASMGYTRIITPSIVNELILGVRRPQERLPFPALASDLAKTVRPSSGFVAGQLYPSANPDQIVPQASFGGVQNSPNFGSFFATRFPQFEDDINVNVANNLSWVKGHHNFKFGIYAERDRVTTGFGFNVPWMGNFNFGTGGNNPGDTGNPYSNALTGAFQNYSEAQHPTKPSALAANIDWFVQDSWKVTKTLTLELGLRVAYFTPWEQTDGLQSSFALGRYKRSDAPLQYRPALVNGTRVAVNPLTGETLNQVFVEKFIPGSGNPGNGFVTTRDGNYPVGFYEKSPELLQPRFGFAWDVFGTGKTAIRGGFGKTNQLVRYEPQSAGAPISFSPTIYNGNLSTFLGAGGVLSPGGATGHDRYMKAPDYYNISLGIQQNVGHAIVIDVKYVSALGRNLTTTRDINRVPYGARFLPQNQDPTKTFNAANPAASALPDSFFRPYPGYGGITYRESSGSSNYHSLQATANRRYTNGLQFGVTYTFSKAMDYASLPTYRSFREWSYGKADFDQTHVFVANYSYDLPKFSKLVSNRLTRVALDNWQLSGITTLASGTPQTVGQSTTSGIDFTGGGDGQRITVIGDPRLAHSDRNVNHFFDTSMFKMSGLNDAGNAARDIYRGPGLIVSDATLFKNIPISGEKRALQLRWEVYNILNHANFSSVDNTARFDPATGAQTNATFGKATAARNPRLMQVSVRFSF
ncbi:MAG: hypothetical protein JWN34_744 [Bryobacterales bacterium]|nr:hypothetical protein [Bryobacterales bacterium]